MRELIERRGWNVEPDAPAIATLVETIAALRSLGQDHLLGHLDSYAEAVEQFTDWRSRRSPSRTDPDQIAESFVIGTILGERIIAALRLLAQEDVSAKRLDQASSRDRSGS